MQSRKLLTILPLLLLLAACNRDPRAQAEHSVEQGNKFYNKGKYHEAMIMYQRAMKADMRYGDAYYRMALADLKLGGYGDAVRMLRRAVELLPNNADAITQLGNLMLLSAAADKAHTALSEKECLDMVDKLLKLDPNSFDAHRILGQVDMVLHHQPADAVKEFEIANRIKPNQADLVLMYFQALVQNNQFAVGEKLIQDLIANQKTYAPAYDVLYISYMRLKRADDAEKILRLKTENNPQNASYLIQLASHYYLSNRRQDLNQVIQTLGDEKKYPDGHLLAGDFFFFRAREYDHAESQYQAAIQAFPKQKPMYEKRLVELYALSGKRQEANNLLATLLKENPKDSDAIAMRAALMLSTGDRQQINMAANDLQALVAKSPQNHLLQFNLARALIAKGDVEATRLHLEQAVKIRADFIAAREILARIYLSKGDGSKALKAAEDIIVYDRGNLQAHLIRSSALLFLGDRDKAREELDFIGRAYPQNPEARYQVGILALQEKDYKKAQGVFTDLYKANPQDRRGLIGMTETMVAEGHLPEAVKEMEAAVNREPERRDLKLFLANLYKRAERYEDSIRIYQFLLDKEPKNPDILWRYAETLRLKGDVNASMENFRKCSQNAPADTMCLMLLGMELQGTGRDDQAVPIYEQILRIDPNHAVALNNLAYIKAQEGLDLDNALTMAQRAVQHSPQQLDFSDTLGWIYIKKNLTEQAIRIFSDLSSKDPKNSTFHFHYGMALAQKGDKPGAKKEFNRALELKPSKDEESRIHEQLQKL